VRSILVPWTVVAIAALVALQMMAVLPADEAGANVSDPGRYVMAMIEYVRGLRDSGAIGDTPIDGTGILRAMVEGGAPVPTATRANPPPASWDLLVTGTYCRVYVEEGGTLQLSDAQDLASVFDGTIYPVATDWFHPDSPPARIDLRVYDMGDGAGGVGGFFIRSFPTRNDLYVDLMDVSISDEVVAHEFEHLLHYDLDPNEEAWLDEGLADLSIRVTLGEGTPALQNHIDIFEMYPENDLLTWDEGVPPDEIETIADYGAAYAYVAYLADHFGGKGTIADLVASGGNSLSSIDSLLSSRGYEETSWDVFLAQRAANLADDPAYGGGIYDQGLFDIGITAMRDTVTDYPYSYKLQDMKRYTPYFFELRAGSPLEVELTSQDEVWTTAVGFSAGAVVMSENLTSSGGTSSSVVLHGFGEEYTKVYLIASSRTQGADLDIDVVPTDPPEVAMTTVPAEPDGDNGWFRTIPTIGLSAPPSANIWYRWDPLAQFQLYTGEVEAPQGQSTLEFYASVGGITGDVQSAVLNVDTIAPAITVAFYPPSPDGPDGFYYTSPRVTLSPEEGSSAWYDLGDGAVDYTGPFYLGSGTYDLDAWARDEAGNVGGPSTTAVKVDLEVPSVELMRAPELPDGENGFYRRPVTLTLLPSEGAAAYYSLDDGSYKPYVSPITLDEGIRTVSYLARTPSGRESVPISQTYKMDWTAPVVGHTTSKRLDGGWENGTVDLFLNCDDPDSTVLYRIGSGEEVHYSFPIMLSDGQYAVTFRAVDPAGNVGESVRVDVRIDTTAPVTGIVLEGDPTQGSWYHDSIPPVTFISEGIVHSPEVTYFSVNGGPFEAFSGSIAGLGSGLNVVRYYSVDAAGNVEPVRFKQIGLDLKDPKAHLKANRTIVGGPGPVRFDLSGSTDDNVVYMYKVDFGDGTDSGWVRDNIIVHEYRALGKYNARAQVMDQSGRVSTNEAKARIEVLTPEEAARRLAEKDGLPIWAFGLIATVVVMALVAIALAIVLVRKRVSSDDVMVIEEEIWD